MTTSTHTHYGVVLSSPKLASANTKQYSPDLGKTANNITYQKEAFPLAGNLSKPDMRSRLAGGVCPNEATIHKGYSDFVQQTGPAISGQLRLVLNEPQTLRGSLRDAQPLRVTFGYSQSLHNSFGVEPTLCADFIGMQIGRNSLMGLDYRGSREIANPLILAESTSSGGCHNSLIISKTCTAVSRLNPLILSVNAAGGCREVKHGGSPSSEVPTKSAGSWWDGADLLHEKGNAVNVAYEDGCFFSHQENQHLAAPQDNLPSLRGDVACLPADNIGAQNHTEIIGEVDRLSLSELVNSPSLSDLVHRLQPSFGQPQNYTGISGEVQPLRLGVLQKPRKTYSGEHYETFVGHRVTDRNPVQPSGVSLVFLRCSALSLRPQASSTQAEKLALGFSGFSRSTLASISSINSCGNRMPLYEDLLFLCPVAIASAYVVMLVSDDNTGRLKTSEVFKHKMIDVFKHHEIRYLNTLSTGKAQEAHKIATPRSAGTLPRRLTTNVNHSNEAAMSNHTTPLAGRNSFTPNKFTWRFLAISRIDRNAKPCRMSVEAHTEREARRVLAPHFILSLAARLPVQGIREIVTPSIIGKSSTVQGVSHV
ncbi:hypothetical protein L581_0712 [Serratia fonticola AU-AP2C]|nr:hypothetical protein L581_0712 [Serratia fonticola AU-AP2C]